MEPHYWWHKDGGKALPKIAKRILSLICSASSCERIWSMYSFIHSKSRNHLTVNKTESLVYIYTNSKLLKQRPGTNHVCQYENNIFSKDSNIDNDGWRETNSEGNNEGGGDDDGYILTDGAQLSGADEPCREQASNNNANGLDADSFYWNGFKDEHPLGCGYCRDRLLIPSNKGVCSIHRLEDYDNVKSDND